MTARRGAADGGLARAGILRRHRDRRGRALLRDRMRDLVRNNPHAAKAVAVLVNNIIGAGIMPPRRERRMTRWTGRSTPSSSAGRRTATPMANSTSTACRR
jgi:hypothetical protein